MYLALSCLVGFASCFTMVQTNVRPKEFVYLHDVDPTIQVSLRYLSDENFVGKTLAGYMKSVVILTKQAADALKKVQEDVRKDGYSLVVYDAYRPQRAVDHFIEWGMDVHSQVTKSRYYPRISKGDVFECGYVGGPSSHSRGSTVDLTLIKTDKKLHEVREKQRTLLDGFTITILDDGTLDMGSSFDLFDKASHYENDLIEPEFKERRAYLKKAMEKHGFENYADEWWHFTLVNEPFPADNPESYFNFPVE